jgi:hypothetical protein
MHYLVDREPRPAERHPVILKLAMQAARAGMPLELSPNTCARWPVTGLTKIPTGPVMSWTG